MKLTRKSGILLHPTSLPGPYGCGDLGTEAYNFVNWLVSARQSLWQMLPLGDIGAGNSPYMSPSAFGGNVLLISLEKCRDAGWLKSEELIPDSAFETARVNYPAVSRYRIERLKLASKRFFDSTEKNPLKSFLDFCQTAAFWLDNYALFKSITDIYKTEESGWQTWPKPPRATRQKGPVRVFRQSCRRNTLLEILPMVLSRTMDGFTRLLPFKRYRYYWRRAYFRFIEQC